MEIISHRGYWIGEEKNSEEAFRRSFSKGFGTETDIRDHNGSLVISHDIPTDSCMDLSVFFELYKKFDSGTLALNIKADGLADLMAKYLDEFNITEYFLFDMSIPDTISYLKKGLKVMVRLSEYEALNPFGDLAYGVWLDSFNGTWYDKDLIEEYIIKSKFVCIVSPELHKRDKDELWPLLKKWNLRDNSKIILCTDFPHEAKKYFLK